MEALAWEMSTMMSGGSSNNNREGGTDRAAWAGKAAKLQTFLDKLKR